MRTQHGKAERVVRHDDREQWRPEQKIERPHPKPPRGENAPQYRKRRIEQCGGMERRIQGGPELFFDGEDHVQSGMVQQLLVGEMVFPDGHLRPREPFGRVHAGTEFRHHSVVEGVLGVLPGPHHADAECAQPDERDQKREHEQDASGPARATAALLCRSHGRDSGRGRICRLHLIYVLLFHGTFPFRFPSVSAGL